MDDNNFDRRAANALFIATTMTIMFWKHTPLFLTLIKLTLHP